MKTPAEIIEMAKARIVEYSEYSSNMAERGSSMAVGAIDALYHCNLLNLDEFVKAMNEIEELTNKVRK